MNTLQILTYGLTTTSYTVPYMQDRIKILLARKMVCMYIRYLIIYSTSALTLTKHYVFDICSISSCLCKLLHPCFADVVQHCPGWPRTCCNHLEYIVVVAMLVSRYNLHDSELLVHDGVWLFGGGGDRSSEYMREQLTSGIIHPWAAFGVVEHVQTNVQDVSYTNGDERENCVSVRSGNVCHAARAVFFPMARKNDVVSHPVKERNNGSDSDFSGPTN